MLTNKNHKDVITREGINNVVQWVCRHLVDSYTWCCFTGEAEKAEQLLALTKDNRILAEQKFSLSDLVEKAGDDAVFTNAGDLLYFKNSLKKNKSYIKYLSRQEDLLVFDDDFIAKSSEWEDILQSIIAEDDYYYAYEIVEKLLSIVKELSYINDCAAVVLALKSQAGGCGEAAFLVAIKLADEFNLANFNDISFLQIKDNSRGDSHVAVVYNGWIIDAWNRDCPVTTYDERLPLCENTYVFNRAPDANGMYRRKISGLDDPIYGDLILIPAGGFCDFRSITPFTSILFKRPHSEAGKIIESVQQAHKDAAQISFAAARCAHAAAEEASRQYVEAGLNSFHLTLVSLNEDCSTSDKKENIVSAQKQVFEFILKQVQQCNHQEAVAILQQAKEHIVVQYGAVNKCIRSELVRVLNRAISKIKKLPTDCVIDGCLDGIYFHGYNYKTEPNPSRLDLKKLIGSGGLFCARRNDVVNLSSGVCGNEHDSLF